ncbi:hypothetical protein DKX38_027976 [Salix brachista]|uniref:Uncharacterized protein n=1 Tax=Salix brachista TaxID=2182728 RepID=A0A5N5J831_9ROSI|nr:hypothetical protein DKX38_027976 [Salix brachista]
MVFSPLYKVKQIELLELKEKLAQKRKILRDWENPYKVNDPRQIEVMEEHLIATLTRVKNKKIFQFKLEEQIDQLRGEVLCYRSRRHNMEKNLIPICMKSQARLESELASVIVVLLLRFNAKPPSVATESSDGKSSKEVIR